MPPAVLTVAQAAFHKRPVFISHLESITGSALVSVAKHRQNLKMYQ